jgi:hypothetical protein
VVVNWNVNELMKSKESSNMVKEVAVAGVPVVSNSGKGFREYQGRIRVAFKQLGVSMISP